MTKSKVLILRKLNIKKDISKKYLSWMNDPDVHRYTEQKYKKHSLLDIKKFVENKNKSKNEFLYGIFFKEKHIGNIELNEIDNQKLTANITYIIGEREYWGKGIASYCINQILKKAKVEFALKKICAGCASKNIASIRVLKKNNFEVELIKRGFFIYDDEMMDCIIFKRLI